MINAQVEKNNNESPLALLRRFNKRVQGAKVINRFKETRFKERNQSHFKKKASALKRMERRDKFNELLKLGKVEEKIVNKR